MKFSEKDTHALTLSALLVVVSHIMACSGDDALIKTVDEIRKDSTRQAELDAEAIAAYIKKKDFAQEIIHLEAGIKILFLRKGNGRAAKPNDIVSMRYTGRYLDDTVFDKAIIRYNYTGGGSSLSDFVSGFRAGITGLFRRQQKGVSRFSQHAKALIIIPSASAYGPRGRGLIPANTVLAFEVDLLSIRP